MDLLSNIHVNCEHRYTMMSTVTNDKETCLNYLDTVNQAGNLIM